MQEELLAVQIEVTRSSNATSTTYSHKKNKSRCDYANARENDKRRNNSLNKITLIEFMSFVIIC